jgi:hypothetical protein
MPIEFERNLSSDFGRRSTYYDAPSVKTDGAEIVATIVAICDEFEGHC